MGFLHQALVFLLATVISVPLFKRLGLGAVLGYLAAGVVVGPACLGLVADPENVLHIAEFGVVLLLFLIGLELQPSRLWELRRTVFGLGSAQVLGTTLVLALAGLALGLRPATAFIAGAGLSMSSTALALQLLSEKNQLTRDYGRASFGILLFQDLAVIPLLAAVPMLGQRAAGTVAQPLWIGALKIVAVLVLVVVVGRFVLRPAFRWVAGTQQSQEVMTAAALLVVVGTALLVSMVGLSMALGAFLAGILLAESEYKHELEADIEPFKGLLLGLFFIAVGMSVELGVIVHRPLAVLGVVVGLIAAKMAVLYAIGRRALGDRESSLSLAVAISQGGEFAFVLFSLAVGHGVMPRELADLLVVAVSVSMALTPLLYVLHERFVRPRLLARPTQPRDFDVAEAGEAPVIIAGFGRVGQVVARVLRAKRIPFTAMDSSSEHIEFVKKFGTKIYYGDASRLDLLRAAHVDKARIFVLAVDTIETSLRIAAEIREHFPHLIVFARARNRQHAYKLLEMGIPHILRDTFAASLEMTADILQELGLPYLDAKATVERFREHDEALLLSSYQYQHDLAKLQQISLVSRDELERIFDEDERQRKSA